MKYYCQSQMIIANDNEYSNLFKTSERLAEWCKSSPMEREVVSTILTYVKKKYENLNHRMM